jgi:hypothetical protein
MYGDMLVWPTTSQRTPTAPLASSSSLRSTRSVWSLSDGAPLDACEIEALVALRAQQRRSRSRLPQQKDAVARLLRSTGKLQEKAQRVERRVRKVSRRAHDANPRPCGSCCTLTAVPASAPLCLTQDFRETNLVCDIPGASSRCLAGHTASGVAVDRQPWPYARVFASDTDGLYDAPPEATGLREATSVSAATCREPLAMPQRTHTVRSTQARESCLLT